jgi:hypothetical protein
VWRWWWQTWRNRARRQVFLHNAILCINQQWWSPSSYDRYGAPLPAFRHTTISQHTMQQVGIVKTRKNYHYQCFLASLRDDVWANCRSGCQPVVMVVPLLQSISSNNDSTYTLYMVPLTAGMLCLPCRQCLGPRQLKFGDY